MIWSLPLGWVLISLCHAKAIFILSLTSWKRELVKSPTLQVLEFLDTFFGLPFLFCKSANSWAHFFFSCNTVKWQCQWQPTHTTDTMFLSSFHNITSSCLHCSSFKLLQQQLYPTVQHQITWVAILPTSFLTAWPWRQCHVFSAFCHGRTLLGVPAFLMSQFRLVMLW